MAGWEVESMDSGGVVSMAKGEDDRSAVAASSMCSGLSS